MTTSTIDFFKLNPRINRIRYFGLHSFWLGVFILTVSLGNIPPAINGIVYVSSSINILFIMIRRLNDFDFRGWWVLVPILPIIVLLFSPGTKGPNRFGDQPSAASLPYKLMGLIIPICFAMLIFRNYSAFTTGLIVNAPVCEPACGFS